MEIVDEFGNKLPPQESNKRIISGVLGILFGAFGVHKFVLGYTNEGLMLLLFTLLTCGVGSALTGLIGLIEGIVYLTKSDEEFYYLYQENKKSWF